MRQLVQDWAKNTNVRPSMHKFPLYKCFHVLDLYKSRALAQISGYIYVVLIFITAYSWWRQTRSRMYVSSWYSSLELVYNVGRGGMGSGKLERWNLFGGTRRGCWIFFRSWTRVEFYFMPRWQTFLINVIKMGVFTTTTTKLNFGI